MPSEAWEVLCPELPPGWARCEPGIEWYFWEAKRRDGSRSVSCAASPAEAWELFADLTTITRRAYAESIAIPKVREAAERAHGDSFYCVEVNIGPDWAEVKVWLGFAGAHANECATATAAPDICTAALRVIKALRGDA